MRRLPIKLAAAATSAGLGLALLTPIAALADNSISTGSATTNVSISNRLNSNVAFVGGGTGDVFVNVSGNGSRSHNSVDVDLNNRTSVNQSNVAFVSNNVNVNANTGDNRVSDNTDSLRLRHMRFCAWHPWSVWCR